MKIEEIEVGKNYWCGGFAMAHRRTCLGKSDTTLVMRDCGGNPLLEQPDNVICEVQPEMETPPRKKLFGLF